ncbi:M28 family peptidase [Natrialba taiwanensis]|uniref:Carboxypeptidase Q n=1 Tax=Natrialba taiwanensis DSM 12281 TaxID=1230458 RepID=M0A5T6_9EURY|nr:M28 family metallopeptidase [Natrialba taiwanensis]ELY94095.1 peptidase M28 [Natrialba taiwanensis DSM 12281]
MDDRDPQSPDERPAGRKPTTLLESAAIERAIGRAWTDDRPWNLLTNLTELPTRMGGSPGERRAAEFVRDALADIGLENTRIDEFGMRYWKRGSSSLAVDTEGPSGERAFETVALPYSPAGELAGPLVDVGYGTPAEIEAADLEGAIAVASTTTPGSQRFVHRMEKYGHAVEAGAAGFVFANHVPGQLPPTGALRFDGEAEIPAVGVSAETGDWLGEYAGRDRDARLRVDAETTAGTSQNVRGTFGPATDETVLVLAHYDAHDTGEGALDNGCGIATVVGATAMLAAIADELDCQVRIAGVGCEEIGLLGAEALADDLHPVPASIRAVVNVDGAGRFRDLQAFSHGSGELEDLADAVATDAGQPIVHEPDPHPFSDHWPFLRAGVPALQLHSEPPAGGERGRGWGHTAADTRDKVDPRTLREHAILTALLVRELTTTEIARIDETELRERLEAQAYEPGMRAASIWPTGWE